MVELIAPKERASGIPASASFAKSLLEYEIIVFWQKGTQSRPLDSDLEFDRHVDLHCPAGIGSRNRSESGGGELRIRIVPTVEVEGIHRIQTKLRLQAFLN